jgi:hypothetical protein
MKDGSDLYVENNVVLMVAWSYMQWHLTVWVVVLSIPHSTGHCTPSYWACLLRMKYLFRKVSSR